VLQLAVQKRVTTSERIFKFSDDTYLLIPAANSIETWASSKNTKLNRGTRGSGKPKTPVGSKQRALVRAGDDVGLVVQVSSHGSEPGQRRYLSRHTISVHVYARVFDSSASQIGWQLRPYSTPYAGIGTYIDVAPNISLTPLRAYEA